ncbi:MAG: RNA polymerase sporulation sigma factor SigE [Acutalibacteraceae bacterium]|nr:RNA polymerase sporulation sigma factor SigE [Acutalibacteraceae bacterium]
MFLILRNFISKIMVRLGICKKIYYINGSETLPAPLTAEEERELLTDYDDKREFVKEKLITHNLRLVVYIAKKFESSSASAEDLVSIGTIGLIKAVNTFQPDKNIKLATYASRCIENEILMYLRKTSVLKCEVSIDEPLNVDWDGNELLLSDVLGSDGEEVGREIEREDERRLLNELVDRLPVREKEIMQLRFGMSGHRELTQKQVADYLGISQSYISRLEKRIIEKLKHQIEKIT